MNRQLTPGDQAALAPGILVDFIVLAAFGMIVAIGAGYAAVCAGWRGVAAVCGAIVAANAIGSIIALVRKW